MSTEICYFIIGITCTDRDNKTEIVVYTSVRRTLTLISKIDNVSVDMISFQLSLILKRKKQKNGELFSGLKKTEFFKSTYFQLWNNRSSK